MFLSGKMGRVFVLAGSSTTTAIPATLLVPTIVSTSTATSCMSESHLVLTINSFLLVLANQATTSVSTATSTALNRTPGESFSGRLNLA
ncbi:unnamed protein product [Didymodactylos carnosus]|uniref:Uncharacterized protein n=1 Tax=Didymodactylos carnosus TaxID=1234261 RepID=A0A8S2F524_9BILA|nr:unnamed protein product [Didymodactylos carnosus]CAF4191794.1 unnamed protein product [Didymodactylos carnosus]